MPPDPAAIVKSLPDWLQVGANVILFLVAIGITVGAYFRGHAKGGEKAEMLDAEAFLESDPVQGFLGSITAIAENMRLQTEAQKVASAALGAIAKLVEDDFDERRVHREVERRLAEREGRRTGSANGWGAP